MSSFLYGLGLSAFRHRWRVLVGWLLALALLGGIAGLVSGDFDDEFSIPGAQSQAALNQLQMNFPEAGGLGASMIVVAPEGKSVSEKGLRADVESSIARLKDLRYVEAATSPWDENVSGLISKGKAAAIVNLQLEGDATTFTDTERDELQEQAALLQEQIPGSQVSMGGEAFSVDIPKLSIVEVAGIGIALVVLMLTLGSFIAAGMPLVTALIGVALTMCLLFIATGLTTINSTTPLLAVMLGLAVGIDYALFILSRHREQLGAGMDVEESAARSVGTAGSAVVFAGLTVIIALLGLAVAQIPFLTVMGVFAALGVFVAVCIALVLLPALMGFAGERMRPKAARPGRRAAKRAAKSPEASEPAPVKRKGRIRAGWVALATKVPALTIAVVLAVSVGLSLPAKDLALALPNSGDHDSSQADRITYDLTDKYFGPGFNGPLIVTAEIIGSEDPLGVMKGLKEDIEAMPGVDNVPISTPNRNADTGFVQVVPTTGPSDPQTRELVEMLRAQSANWEREYGVATAVTGVTAVQIDVSERLGEALLPFGIFVVGLSLVLLTMVFRSIAVPIKATLGYLLSIGVAFGVTTMVFNKGWGKEIINLEQAGPVISFLPILMMGILFGLAMDYEVFLVSRMREEYVHGASAQEAIRKGFIGSSVVVTAAAAIMFFVFAFFVPAGEGPIKSIAFALAVGVAFDAFVVRMTLVPAVMALLGDRAWWLPRWLDRRLPSLDVEGESLRSQLELTQWPDPELGLVVYTEDLGVGDLFSGLNLSLRAGQVLVVEGSPTSRAALIYTLAGRMQPERGRARVGGYLLDGQAAGVRRNSTLIDASGSANLLTDFQTAKKANRSVVMIDGADALASREETHEMQRLIDDCTTGDSERALVLGVSEADSVAKFLTHGFYVVDLASGADRVLFSAPRQPQNNFSPAPVVQQAPLKLEQTSEGASRVIS